MDCCIKVSHLCYVSFSSLVMLSDSSCFVESKQTSRNFIDVQLDLALNYKEN